jgi:hypothetical protein
VGVSELAEFMVDVITVRPLLGTGGLGASWGTPEQHLVFADDKVRLVRSAVGDQVVSATTVYDDNVEHTYPLGSDVTLPSGRVAQVIACNRRENALLDLPAHLEVQLT